MARIRYLKPELFLDEDLGALSGDHVVLFTALWTQADREGRLEDRPARIKASTFPYREVAVEPLLADLVRVGKLIRYEADGVRVIAIPGFKKHQRPHPKEVASVLPPPPSREKTRPEISGREKPGSIPSSPGSMGTGREQERNGEVEGTELGSPPPYLSAFVEPPASEPADWTGDDFWRWFQHKRQQARFVPEKPPHPSKLGAWWSYVRMAVRDVEAIREAVYRFAEDRYWQSKDPALPFAGFMSQWQKYMPQLEARHV